MAREFTSKLTKDDLEYLRSRHHEAYVQHQIALLGTTVKSEQPQNAAESADESTNGTDAQDTGDDAGDGAGEGDEDLIGSPDPSDVPVFDSMAATEGEVKSYLESLDPERVQVEKDRIRTLEESREDREPRKGVLTLVS